MTKPTSDTTNTPITIPNKRVATRDAWLDARRALLAREKAFTKERDALSAARRELPMVKVDKRYVFEEPSGKRTLGDLFEGKPQLMIYHFMFDPSWEEGCKSCSFVADNFERSVVHLAARDIAFAAISRGPLAKLLAFQKRMGWTFRWLSSNETDFNYDYQVSFKPGSAEREYNYRKSESKGELPGLSVFLRDDKGDIFHTYSTYGRGLDMLIGTYNYIDLTPLGRHEESPMAWVRYRDKYDAAAT